MSKRTHKKDPGVPHHQTNITPGSMGKNTWGRYLLWFKIFLIGLLLQFFLHTLFTFQFGFSWGFWNLIWLWKEVFIIIWAGVVAWLLFFNTSPDLSLKERRIIGKPLSCDRRERTRRGVGVRWFIFVFIITIIIILGVSLKTSTIIDAIISIRYSMMGFFIFIVAGLLGYFLVSAKQHTQLLKWRRRVMKVILVIGLFWWGVVWLMPNGLKFFWYNQNAYEGEVGARPPATYYTEYKQGLVRNQFLFERPISYGFFLIALWPLFFILAIKGKHHRELLWRGGLYGLNIFSTFSRAAWGAWFVQTIILFFIVYHKHWKKMLLYFWGPALLMIGVVGYFAADQIMHRQFSTTGHINEIKTAIQKIQAHPLLGAGVGSAGPASHQIKQFEPYNTENQYLQIWVEYGILGLLWWGYLYFFLHYVGYLAWKDEKKYLEKKQEHTRMKKNKILQHYHYYIIAFSLGILGLSIENLVLHGFVDRMIVYPVMLLFWLSYGVWMRIKENEK